LLVLRSTCYSGWWLKKTSWKIWVKVNGKDDIPYMKWKNNQNVPNHQPDDDWL
jgi:hypothetical protein